MAKSGVDTPEEQTEGILGLNAKLGLGRGTKKKAPKPPMLGYGAVPQLPEIAAQQRKVEEDAPQGNSKDPMNKMKNKYARSFLGGNKEMV